MSHRAWLGLSWMLVVMAPGLSGWDDGSYLNKSAASWAKELRGSQPVKRRAAAFALGKLGIAALPHVPELGRALSGDEDAGVRTAAASALGELGSWSSGDILSALLTACQREKSLPVVRAAARALGKLGERGGTAEPKLREFLSHADPGVRQSAAWSLGQLGVAAAPAVDALALALEDGDPQVRREVVAALGNLGSVARSALPVLIKHLRDEDALTQESVVMTLRSFGPMASASLIPLLELVESKAQPEKLREAALVTVEQVWPAGEKMELEWNRLRRLDSESQPDALRRTVRQSIERIKTIRE